MRHWIRAAWCLLLGIFWSCGGDGGGGGGIDDPTYSDTDLYNPGMGGVGNGGPMQQFIPTDWSYLGGVDNFGTLQLCLDTGFCGHGGADVAFGSMESAEDSLIYLLTANYTTTDFNAVPDPVEIVVVVRTTGVEHDSINVPATPADKKLRLAFQYAFLTSRDVDGDSAVVRVFPDDDSLSTQLVLRVHSSQLGDDIPLRSSGCGTVGIPSDSANAVETTYSRCSDWRDAEYDITAFRGHSITTQFVLGEAGADTDHGIALLIRQVRIQQED